jgi:hypothetical protein
MKAWFGVLGRSCLEFLIVLVVAAFIAGASASLGAQAASFATLLFFSRKALLGLIPVAATLTVFLSMFSFERRVKSRLSAWLGALLLGALLFSVGMAARRFPLLRDLAEPKGRAAASAGLQAPGLGTDREGLVLWYRSAEGTRAEDAVAVDFRAPSPRLVYAASSPLDAARGEILIGGKAYGATAPRQALAPLLPEAELFAGFWLWDRFAGLDGSPLIAAAAACAGFILLVSGFRFLVRLTRWPLANAFFAIAGFLGLLVLDAFLASPAVTAVGASLAGRAGLASVSPALFLGAIEAAAGFVFGAAELALAPRERASRG